MEKVLWALSVVTIDSSAAHIQFGVYGNEYIGNFDLIGFLSVHFISASLLHFTHQVGGAIYVLHFIVIIYNDEIMV